MTALNTADQMGKDLFSELEKGPKADMERCHELVEKGANLRFIGTANNHALILAILYNHDDLALGMMKKDPGVIDLPGSNKNAPVMFAIYRDSLSVGDERYLDLITAFAEANANFLAENFVGTTPLKAAELRDAHRPSNVSEKALNIVVQKTEEQIKLKTPEMKEGSTLKSFAPTLE